MQTVYILGFTVFSSLLIVIAGIIPRRSTLSIFELERRRTSGNKSAAEELRREVLLDDVLSIKTVVQALLLVFVVIASVAAFGSIFGVLVALLVALGYNRVARAEIVRTLANRIYEQFEPALIQFVDRHPRVGKMIRTVTMSQPIEPNIGSRQELEHVVSCCSGILGEDEKKLLINGLRFNQKTVESVMTPRGVIETIKSDVMVGPLTLNDLHQTGHSRFPVIDGDLDHVVGTLYIKEMLSLNNKKSTTAQKAMDPNVYYINQDQTLQHALAAFIKTHHQLFIVVNGYRETAGILTLEDVIEALLGRKIVDEFDLHDDLRVVAARAAKTNNNPPHRTDV